MTIQSFISVKEQFILKIIKLKKNNLKLQKKKIEKVLIPRIIVVKTNLI